MSELVAFLEARLAEDEAVARAAEDPGAWEVRPYEASGIEDEVFVVSVDGPNEVYNAVCGAEYEGYHSTVAPGNATHIARHDPARVLREVTAKRAILAAYVTVTEASERNTAEHTQASAGWPDAQDRIYQLRTHGWQLSGRLEGLEVALRALAAVFSDHPDFQEQWR